MSDVPEMFDTVQADKAHEMSIRRAAARFGLRVARSRARRHDSPDYGRWTLRDATGTLLAAGGLDAVERTLQALAAETP